MTLPQIDLGATLLSLDTGKKLKDALEMADHVKKVRLKVLMHSKIFRTTVKRYRNALAVLWTDDQAADGLGASRDPLNSLGQAILNLSFCLKPGLF